MADTKISNLTTATTINDTDYFTGVSGSTNYKVTFSTIKASIPGVGTSGGSGTIAVFNSTGDKTISNTVTQTSLVGSGYGSNVLASGYFTAGKTLKIEAWGYFRTVTGPGTGVAFTLVNKLNSTTILNSNSVSLTNSINSLWKYNGVVTCRTTGASGTVMCQGDFTYLDSTTYKMVPLSGSAVVTVDTTIPLTGDIMGTWGTADTGNSITCTNLNMITYN